APTLGAPPPTPAGERLPPATLAFYDHVLRRDAAGAWWFEALWTEARAAALETRRAELAARLSELAGQPTGLAARPANLAAQPADLAPPTANLGPHSANLATQPDVEGGGPQPVRTGPWRATPSVVGHARAVEACRERIAAGDLFQANLALRLRSELQEGEAVDLWARGVEALAPDRAAWLAGDGVAIASLSPELFLARRGETVRTAPIKGTRPRPADEQEAAAERAELAGSAKDRAENVMIVDLMRNDLGRVCVPGSVAVTRLAEVRPHAGVWHLVSEVVGRLAPDVGDAALVAATFPPGSVTGAPKLAAMDVISTLEGVARQSFCGAIGFASPTAGLELSVAIRTFECSGTSIWLDVGGGIVADSDPAAEAAECLAKALPLLRAIGAEPPPEHPTGGRRGGAPSGVPVPLRLGAHPVPRPDPARGVFETVLVVDGVAVAVEEHVERLRSAAEEVYGVGVPEAVGALVAHTAMEQGGSCRIRVVLKPWGDVGLEVAALPAAGDGTLRLEPVAVAGGLGDRKWRDRRLVDALDEAVGPALPLLVDLDGGVLETTRSNVFALIEDTLVTPPLDGRILPGVTRALAIGVARDLGLAVAERPLGLQALAGADAVLTSGALRGLQPVTALGAQPLPRIPDRLRTLVEQFPPLR
ncbi:MAG TPA: chorismate-binding protein, partial [Baekduia sp.]